MRYSEIPLADGQYGGHDGELELKETVKEISGLLRDWWVSPSLIAHNIQFLPLENSKGKSIMLMCVGEREN